MHKSYSNRIPVHGPCPGMRVADQIFITAFLLLISITLTACKVRDDKKSATASILLFNGTGASPNDVKAVETLLSGNHLNYSTVNSLQLNQMGESQIRGYRLLIVPGGNFIDIGNSLSSGTTTNIRNAVKNGTNYLGVCAGGFLAGKFTDYNSLNLTSGVKFGFYSAENKGVRKASVSITAAGGPTLDHYWEDGPQFTGWGAIVAKYPDGTPAIVEGTFGSGWVILTGVHPEAPEAWRGGMTFNTPATADNAYAATLIQAALNGTRLPHY
jgi:glutamine amidotransferase-like uncharacterized protein